MGGAPRARRSLGAQVVVTTLVAVVAVALGVSLGGALLAAVGLILALGAAVVGLTFWRRRRRALALASYAVAVLATAAAVKGFVDAVS